MSAKKTELQQAAFLLRNTAPEEFEHFLKHLSTRVDQITVAVTDADAASILTAQGRAQFARFLLRELKECEPTSR